MTTAARHRPRRLGDGRRGVWLEPSARAVAKVDVMTVTSHPFVEEWGPPPPHRRHARDQVLSRRRARRMSRHFAVVGVGIPAVRLQEIAAGRSLASDDLVNVSFALVANEVMREERLAKFKRGRRRATRWLIFAGATLASLSALCCIVFAFVSLALYESPL